MAKIPNGWYFAECICSIIHMNQKAQTPSSGPRFVMFKTPIKSTSWSPHHVMEKCPDMKDEKSGCLIINIKPNEAAVSRYNPKVFQNEGVEYAEVYVRGTGRAPPDFVVSEFFDHVDDFLEKRPNGLIGVHGTKGVNRPGYLIARYLIENFSWDPKAAIKKINASRKEKITEKGLIIDLKESHSHWETKIMQHCVVVDFFTPRNVDRFDNNAKKELKEVINMVLRTVPRDAIEWPEPDDVLRHQNKQHADLAAMNYEDFVEDQPEKTRWIGTHFLRLWFRKGWVKRKIIEIAEQLPEDSWKDFKIVRYEDRSKRGELYD